MIEELKVNDEKMTFDYAETPKEPKEAMNTKDEIESAGSSEPLRSLQWSDWTALKNLDLSKVPSIAGVYQMRWASSGKPNPISRANGVDESGIVYIGKALSLKRRLKALYRGITEGRPTHTAAYTYMWDNFGKKFKPDQLEVHWANAPKDEIGDYEFDLISDYVKNYIDTPPLNITRGRK